MHVILMPCIFETGNTSCYGKDESKPMVFSKSLHSYYFSNSFGNTFCESPRKLGSELSSGTSHFQYHFGWTPFLPFRCLPLHRRITIYFHLCVVAAGVSACDPKTLRGVCILFTLTTKLQLQRNRALM